MSKKLIDRFVDRFLACPLPQSVRADSCACNPHYPHQRTGTNLLTATEAKQVLEHVLGCLTAEEDDATRHVETIMGLQSALREVYAMAGEDPQLSKIINTALDEYQFP